MAGAGVAHEVSGVDKRLVCTLREVDLTGPVTFLADPDVLVYRDGAGGLRATRNRCRHKGGRFGKGGGCVLTCANHGWRLDLSRMEYVNPVGGIAQEELLVERGPDGTWSLFDVLPPLPWATDPRPSQPLAPGELTVRFYAHACVEITCGAKRLFTDPWLVGPAFVRGWWLAQEPPADWLDRLSTADAIYISHNHSDHLNLHTLRRLAARNPAIPVYVPRFERDYCGARLARAGLVDVRPTPFGVWVPLDADTRLMILPDAARGGDSGLLVDYKGHRLLDNVDCSNIVGGAAPEPVDVLLTVFGGGATGYPVCWGELYPEERIHQLVLQRRRAVSQNVVRLATLTKARTVVLFASYFTEAHPADAEIRRLNGKNSPAEVEEVLRQRCPTATVWAPAPGATFDVASHSGRAPALPTGEPPRDFDAYLAELADDAGFPPLQTLAGIARYFQWAGFRSPDLVLHVLETDEDFARVEREFYVDFADLSFPPARPPRPHRYLRMKVRAPVFRHVLRHGASWEEISIGFQARLYREPDVYNFDFWDHFQNRLPVAPPDWSRGAR